MLLAAQASLARSVRWDHSPQSKRGYKALTGKGSGGDRRGFSSRATKRSYCYAAVSDCVGGFYVSSGISTEEALDERVRDHHDIPV